MNQAVFHLKRDNYAQDAEKRETTLGAMFTPEGNGFGFTLEDVVRGYGIKSMHRTAIPATEGDFTYKLGVRVSPKYGKCAVIYTEKQGEDTYILDYGGVSFEQILVHGGNDPEDTSGCVLLAKNRSDKDMNIYGSLKKEFAEEVERLIEEGYDTRLRITNLPQEA